jgi:hypothetical protein
VGRIRTIAGTLTSTTIAQRVIQVRLLEPVDNILVEVFDPALGAKVIPELLQFGAFSAPAVAAIVAGTEGIEFDTTGDLTLTGLFPFASNRSTNHGALALPGVNGCCLPRLPPATTFFVWFYDGAASGARPTAMNYSVSFWEGGRSISTG